MKKIIFILFSLVLTMNVFGQEVMSGLTYNMGTTVGETRDFVEDYSWRGFGFEVRNFRSDNFSVGGSFSWNLFDQKTSEVIELENGAASGTQIRYLNAFPLFLNAHYYFGDGSSQLRPYLGLNVGTYYMIQRLEIGIFALESDAWHFGMAPELGFMITGMSGSSFFANVRYNYAFEAGDYVGGGKDWAYLGFNVGVAFSYNAW